MIRTVRHSLSLLLSLAALALIPAAPTAVNAADSTARMELPAPDKTAGMPLMQALAQRRSIKTGFSGAALSPQQLSDLLGATWGVNRDGGRRTARHSDTGSPHAPRPIRCSAVWRRAG